MILYFSATGNTKYIASELAKALNDSIIDLREKIREKDYTPIHSAKPFVICSPVYVSEPPRFLMDFLRRTRLTGNPNVYFVFSSGGYSGISAIMGHQLAVKKKMKYKGTADFIMPSNYIAENMFPLQDTQEIEKRILRAQRKIKKTAATIRSGGILKSRYIWLWEYFVTLPFYPVWYQLRQGVKDFHVNNVNGSVRCMSSRCTAVSRSGKAEPARTACPASRTVRFRPSNTGRSRRAKNAIILRTTAMSSQKRHPTHT